MARNRGAALIVVTILMMLVGALSGVFQATSLTYYRASSESMDQELAIRDARSGVSYYLGQLNLDSGYFNSNPAPHDPLSMGNGSFSLESAEATGNQWNVVVVGTHGQASYRLAATIGNSVSQIPAGIVIAGKGNLDDEVFSLKSDSSVASYDPSLGLYSLGHDAEIRLDGSLALSFFSAIYGDVTATGTLISGDPLSITGKLTEGAAKTPVEDIDPIVNNIFQSSRLANDNNVLFSIFGDQWTRRSPAYRNYGDLIVEGGTYVIPPGTYRFRRFEVKDGATVIFDTSSGPTTLVYLGAGRGTNRRNDLTVEKSSAIKINPEGTTNGLLTVLGPYTDLKVKKESIFGQAIGDETNAGYSQIISVSGNRSYDDLVATDRSVVYGRIHASAHNLAVDDNSVWFGSGVVRTTSLESGFFVVDTGRLGRMLTNKRRVEVLAKWSAGAATDDAGETPALSVGG